MTVERSSIFSLFAKVENLDSSSLNDEEEKNLEQKILRLGEITILNAASSSNPITVRTLNPKVIDASDKIRTHLSYKEKDAISALKFLEIFLIYAFYENRVLEISQESVNADGDVLIEKSLRCAQNIWSRVHSKKAHRKSLLLELENLKKKMTKVLTRRIQPSEIPTFQKSVEKALKILKKYISQK